MKIIFFGTPEYVIPILSKLAKSHEILAVVTQPPMPVGREQFKKYSPVDDWAHKRNIPIFFDFDKPFPKADLGVCAAYGKIIPKFVICPSAGGTGNLKFGILNIHPSLLPKYRGASPIPAAILAGDKETGVTIIKMDEKMDHGPIITQFTEDINPEDTADTLRNKLFERSAQVLIDLIPNYLKGKIKLKEQNHDQATFTKVLTKQDGFIDLAGHQSPCLAGRQAITVHNFIRAMNPWPGAWTFINKKRLKILKAHLENKELILDEVQLEGKNPVSWKQFKEAYPEFSF